MLVGLFELEHFTSAGHCRPYKNKSTFTDTILIIIMSATVAL